jgi:hypothetical protein
MRNHPAFLTLTVLVLTTSSIAWFVLTLGGWNSIVMLVLGLPIIGYWCYRLWLQYRARE